MNTLVICDIDGVLADISHRLHYLEEKDYKNFYGVAMANDKVIESGNNLVKSLRDGRSFMEADVWLLTGRPEQTRAMTKQWVESVTSLYISSTMFLMRPDGDYRPSPELKVELLKKRRRELKKYDLVYFIDDDPENVKAVEKAFPNITGIVFSTKRF